MYEKNESIIDKQSVLIDNKRIEELSIYYLYFLCSFMDKITEKVKDVTVKSRKNIPFRKFLSENFLNYCENIKVESLDMVDELESFRDVKINFCERFIFFVNEVNKDREKSFYSELRKHVYADLRYICSCFFGIILSEKNIYIEEVLQFFNSVFYNLKQNKIKDSIFVIEPIQLDKNGINSSYIPGFNNSENEETLYVDESDIELYLKKKDNLNTKLIDYNNKIGYRLASKVVIPLVQDKYVLAETLFDGIITLADEFVSCYFSVIQNEYLLNYFNEILTLKDMDAVNKYIDKSKKENFVSLDDMETLVKNGNTRNT